jgi:enoyl-CoA hydratase/carnithine racemase
MINISYSDIFCTITLERLAKNNCLNGQMYIEMSDALSKASQSKILKAIIIRGKGDYFCGGHELQEFLDNPENLNSQHPMLKFLTFLEHCPKLLICVLDGHAVGIGATILLHADFVIAQKHIDISMPAIQMGLCPEAGATQLLERTIGKPLAREMILLGRTIKAERLKELLINELTTSTVQSDALLTLVKKQIAELPLSGILKNKDLMRPKSESLHSTMEKEIQSLAVLLESKKTQKLIARKMNGGK